MPRNRKNDVVDITGKDRWMVSYADFMTLLFAFFVVMYAVSSVNEGKYRVLSESLTTAFKDVARTLEPIQVGEVKRSGDPSTIKLVKQPVVIDRSDIPAPQIKPRIGEHKDAGDKPLEVLFDGLKTSVAALNDRGLIKVHNFEFGIEVEISTSVLFSSGQAQLSPQAEPIISKLADVLRPFPHEINVQGYTDNQAIRSNIYPSNWELSSARAASVVQVFARLGVDEKRLSATGFGEFRPVAENTTEQGRQSNRRVVVYIPVFRDKAKVMDAIKRLNRDLNKGVTFEQPAGPDSREGFRSNIEDAKAKIIDQPANETRFFNQSVGATQSQSGAGQTTDLEGEKIDGGVSHIGRQPIGTLPAGDAP